MKLIDAPIGIFRFDGELVLKTEYKSENRQNGKYIPDCYIVRTGEYFWGGAKTANELNNLDVEPVDFAELLPTVTDTISRQAAIEALDEYFERIGKLKRRGLNKGEKAISLDTVGAIKSLPPAQPEIIRCKDCKHWKDSDGVFRRGIGAESRCPLNLHQVYEGTFFCGLGERREVTT